MKKKRKSILFRFVFVLFFIYFLKIFLFYILKSVKTEAAEFVSFENFIISEAFSVFDENFLECRDPSSFFCKVSEGRISGSDVVAYEMSTNDIKNKIKYENEKNKSILLTNAKELFFSKDPSTLNKKINENILNFKKNIKYSFYDFEKSNGLLFLFIQFEKMLGNSAIDGFVSKEIKNSENEKAKLCFKYGVEIKTDSPGFFSLNEDNFNKHIKYQDLIENKTDFDFVLSKKQKNANYLGKIIKSRKCFLVCKIKNEDVPAFNSKKHVEFKLRLNKNDRFSGSILSILPKDGFAILILSTEVKGYLLGFEYEDIKILTESHSGFKIKKKSLKNIGDKTGVFVKHKRKLEFRKVSAVHEKDGYFICESDELDIGDLVVTSGNNLYEGKVVANF
jgi:hypothetical protein